MQNGSKLSPTRSDRSAFFTVKDAANYLGISPYAIYSWFKRGKGPPHIKIRCSEKDNSNSNRYLIRIPKEKFIDWIAQNEV